MKVGFRGLLAVLLLVPLVAAPPAFAQFRPVAGREYREYFNPVNPVRGEAVIGITMRPTEDQQRAPMVQVLVPAGYSGEIHLEVASADGKFRGEGVFAGATKNKEWISLPLTASATKEGTPTFTRPVSPLSLAVVARGSGGAVFLVRWGAASLADKPEDHVRFYVNSRRAEMFVRGAAGTAPVRCRPIGVAQPIRFDTHCDVPLADIPADGQISLIRRDQFDEQTQDLKVLVK